MNKLVISIITITLIILNSKIISQESNNKKLQMGIILGTSLNFNKTDTKIIKTKNPGYDLTIGMNIIKKINENLGFNTGIEFDFSTMQYSFQDTLYYRYIDKEIYSKKDINENEIYSVFFLQERTQKPIYLSIPTMFIFRTDYIGYNSYFTKFGMRHNITLKDIVSDKGILEKENDRMKISNDLAIYSGSIGISAGTEWNYSGSSSIMFELGYYYGISNLHRGDALIGDVDKNKSMYDNQKKYQTIKSTRNQLAFKLSLLF